MAYVVCEPCRDCKYTDCVVVCPSECFYEDGRMLYIDPNDCIDCDACKPECPVEAIYPDIEVPAVWVAYIALNAEQSAAIRASGAPVLQEKKDALEAGGCVQRK